MNKIILLLTFFIIFVGCAPRAIVKVETSKPIEINLNINIKHEIKVEVDKELDNLFKKDDDIF